MIELDNAAIKARVKIAPLIANIHRPRKTPNATWPVVSELRALGVYVGVMAGRGARGAPSLPARSVVVVGGSTAARRWYTATGMRTMSKSPAMRPMMCGDISNVSTSRHGTCSCASRGCGPLGHDGAFEGGDALPAQCADVDAVGGGGFDGAYGAVGFDVVDEHDVADSVDGFVDGDVAGL